MLLNRRTQQEIRRMKTGGGVVTTSLFTAGRAIVGSRDYTLYGFNAADGTVAWKFSYRFSWVESIAATGGRRDLRRRIGLPAHHRAEPCGTARRILVHRSPASPGGWPVVTTDTVFIGTAAQNIPGTLIKHTGGIMALDPENRCSEVAVARAGAARELSGGYAGFACAGRRQDHRHQQVCSSPSPHLAPSAGLRRS